MSEYKFDCPHCGQSLSADDELLGSQVECPACQEAIQVPEPVSLAKPTAPRIKRPPPPPRPQAATSQAADAERRGSLLYLIASPTVLVVGIAVFLPFVNVSCSSEKLVSMSAYGMLTGEKQDGGEAGEALALTERKGMVYAGVALVILGGIGASLAGGLLAFRYRKKLLVGALVGCAVAICVVLLAGYQLGIKAEREIEKQQVAGVADADGWELLGGGLVAGVDISIGMDAGYYLLLAGLFLGLAGLVVPRIFSPPIDRNKVVGGSVAGGVLGAVTLYAVVVCMVNLGNPARFQDMGAMADAFGGGGDGAGEEQVVAAKADAEAERWAAAMKEDAEREEAKAKREDAERRAAAAAAEKRIAALKAAKAEALAAEEKAAAEAKAAKKAAAEAEAAAVAAFDLVGLKMRMSILEARKVMAAGPLRATLTSAKGDAGGEYIVLYAGSHRLKGARGTALYFWQGRLFKVGILFRAANEELEHLFEVLAKKLTDKHGEKQSVISMGDAAGWHMGGINVVMQRDVGFMKEGTLALVATEGAMEEEVKQSKIAKDAAAMGDL